MAIALLVGACGGSSDEAAPTPEPTAEIADAPTATPVPAEEPTATTSPTATVAPEPTAAPDLTVEKEVIAAWERYLDLSIQARGKEPTGDAANLATFLSGDARVRLREVIDQQLADGQYIAGSAQSLSPFITVESGSTVLVEDCVAVDLSRVERATDSVLGTQVDVRTAVARFELVDGVWLLTAVDTGEGGDECDA